MKNRLMMPGNWQICNGFVLMDTFKKLQQVLATHQPLKISGEYPEAAVLVAINDDPVNPGLLLTQRAQHLAIHSGEVAFPGGKCDLEDASLLGTALREAEEEVELAQDQFHFIGCLDQRITRSGIRVTPFVGMIPAAAKLVANLDEIDAFFYTPLDFFLEPANLHIDQVVYQQELRHIPRFDFESYCIWGVTAMIIVDLMNTVFNAGLSLQPQEGESSDL